MEWKWRKRRRLPGSACVQQGDLASRLHGQGRAGLFKRTARYGTGRGPIRASLIIAWKAYAVQPQVNYPKPILSSFAGLRCLSCWLGGSCSRKARRCDKGRGNRGDDPPDVVTVFLLEVAIRRSHLPTRVVCVHVCRHSAHAHLQTTHVSSLDCLHFSFVASLHSTLGFAIDIPPGNTP